MHLHKVLTNHDGEKYPAPALYIDAYNGITKLKLTLHNGEKAAIERPLRNLPTVLKENNRQFRVFSAT